MKLVHKPRKTQAVVKNAAGVVISKRTLYWGHQIQRQIWIREGVQYDIPKFNIYTRSYLESYPMEANLSRDENDIDARIKAFLGAWRMKTKSRT